MSPCIDLSERFGSRYRVTHEESYTAERGQHGRTHEPCLQMIPCRHGSIYVHGGELLGASTKFRGRVAKRLAALPCVRIAQDGDDGVNVVFRVTDFDTVAAILKPKRRRKLTPEQVAERTERLRRYQFSSAGQNAGKGRICVASPTPLPQAA